LLKNAGSQVRSKRRAPDTALIVNPNSRGGLTGRNWDELYAEIEKILGSGISVTFGKRHGNGTVLAGTCCAEGLAWLSP
jgi:hypothetical protein